MFLENIQHPSEIQSLNAEELIELSTELREYIIETILHNGGHFAANLGVIELTTVLLKNFNLNSDQIVWDVGHQSYPYKVLTQRKEELKSIRNMNGISGFPKIDESNFDHFGTGHSSTAISAAMGMAQAAKINNEPNRNFIAVVGDGALTGGMSYEALNNIVNSNLNITIVLNDNQIGIDPNTGALNHHLTNDDYPQVKQWFEWFGLNYNGPVDGHNVYELLSAFENSKSIQGPKIIHIKTIKGKGYLPAEKEQTKYHSTNKYVKIQPDENSISKKWQDVFGEILVELATQNTHIVGITPAMPSSCGMQKAMDIFPGRFFDVGISEQHAVTFAAGLATQGKIPFVNIYSTFLQRAYDQIIHDVALQNLPVVFCIDRAGLVGEDGPTHHGAFDISFLNCIPNIEIFAPKNVQELYNNMRYAVSAGKPIAIRYPKGFVKNDEWSSENITKTESIIVSNNKILVISTGIASNFVETAKSKTSISFDSLHLNQIKPIPDFNFSQYSKIITVEDGSIIGGFGQSIKMHHSNFKGSWLNLGIPDQFIPHGNNENLYEMAGYGIDSIVSAIESDY
jgi:1-deoxy-D-xylulose-5-phosphate synthase